MKQRELIDYCNSTPWFHCNDGCPYDKECDAYLNKYGELPCFEDDFAPERYTDEEIVMEGSSDE